MIMEILKQLKATTFIIPNNFCFSNIAKKSSPETPLVRSQTLQSEVAKTHPDGNGHFASIFFKSVD